LPGNPNTISANLPPALPGGANGVLYLVQPGVTPANITTFPSNTNPLVDDSFCHDWGTNPIGGMTYYPPNLRCTDLPGGTGWFTTVNSVAPFANSANPIDYRWVRVTLKRNDSTPHGAYTLVDATRPAGNKVCWDGTMEVAIDNNANPCSSLSPTANPVYLVTSLAVSVTGTRRMIQQEIHRIPRQVSAFPMDCSQPVRAAAHLTWAVAPRPSASTQPQLVRLASQPAPRSVPAAATSDRMATSASAETPQPYMGALPRPSAVSET